MDQHGFAALGYLQQNPQFQQRFASNRLSLGRNGIDYVPNQPIKTEVLKGFEYFYGRQKRFQKEPNQHRTYELGMRIKIREIGKEVNVNEKKEHAYICISIALCSYICQITDEMELLKQNQ